MNFAVTCFDGFLHKSNATKEKKEIRIAIRIIQNFLFLLIFSNKTAYPVVFPQWGQLFKASNFRFLQFSQ